MRLVFPLSLFISFSTIANKNQTCVVVRVLSSTAVHRGVDQVRWEVLQSGKSLFDDAHRHLAPPLPVASLSFSDFKNGEENKSQSYLFIFS